MCQEYSGNERAYFTLSNIEIKSNVLKALFLYHFQRQGVEG